MSDRIARLAELRRKRDSASAKSPEVPTHSVTELPNQLAAGEHSATIENEKNKSHDVPIILKVQSESTEASEAQFVDDDEAPSNDKSSSESSSVGEHGADTTENGYEFAAYNRDLKKDMSLLLNKAKLDTDKAINEILWQLYREKQAD